MSFWRRLFTSEPSVKSGAFNPPMPAGYQAVKPASHSPKPTVQFASKPRPTPCQGIVTMLKVCSNSRSRLLSLKEDPSFKQAIVELKQEGGKGVQALAELIDELLAARCAEIQDVLEAAQYFSPQPELVDSIERVVSAAPVIPGQPGRFAPVIVGGGKIGWDDSSARRIKENASEVLTALRGSSPVKPSASPVSSPPAGVGAKAPVDRDGITVLMDRIKAIPNSAIFLAEFPSTEIAVQALKNLSFVGVDQRGMALPKGILCEYSKYPNRTEIIIGGSLSEGQRVEIHDVFKRHGEIKAVALPKNEAESPRPSADRTSSPGAAEANRGAIVLTSEQLALLRGSAGVSSSEKTLIVAQPKRTWHADYGSTASQEALEQGFIDNDQRATVVKIQLGEKCDFKVRGVASCHECSSSISFEAKSYFGLGGGAGNPWCPSCKAQISVSCEQASRDSVEVFLIAKPWTVRTGSSVRKMAVEIRDVTAWVQERG